MLEVGKCKKDNRKNKLHPLNFQLYFARYKKNIKNDRLFLKNGLK